MKPLLPPIFTTDPGPPFPSSIEETAQEVFPGKVGVSGSSDKPRVHDLYDDIP